MDDRAGVAASGEPDSAQWTGESDRWAGESDRWAGRVTDAVAAHSSRRGFLARVGRLMLVATGGAAVTGAVRPGQADAAYYTFCGHTYTTASCPHPTGLPRVDLHNRPLRAADGQPVDDLGRPVDGQGRPIDATGHPLLDPDGNPLPPAPRSRVCLDLVASRYGLRTHIDGSWYRCCGGHVRRLIDCCAHTNHRINGDAALTGYCYHGRKVFCVHYYQSTVPC